MSLEAFSIARKQKLQMLRKRKADEEAGLVGSTRSSSFDDASLSVKRSFRNYDPITGQMKRFTSVRDLPDTIEKDVEGLQKSTIEEDERKRAEDLDLTNIAPKRINWDLKRDYGKRLKKLERRDREAILILIRQRIQSQQKQATSKADGEDSVSALGAEIAATATEDVGNLFLNQEDESDLSEVADGEDE